MDSASGNRSGAHVESLRRCSKQRQRTEFNCREHQHLLTPHVATPRSDAEVTAGQERCSSGDPLCCRSDRPHDGRVQLFTEGNEPLGVTLEGRITDSFGFSCLRGEQRGKPFTDLSRIHVERIATFSFRIADHRKAPCRKVPYSLHMTSVLTVKETAARLGATKPTVGALIRGGTLQATKQARGSLFRWLVDAQSVESFLNKHGRYDDETLHAAKPSLKSMEQRVSVLEQLVRPAGSRDAVTTTRTRELEDARARIVNLEEALARSRVAAELQTEADGARAEVIQHLLAATAAAERVDGLRRRATAELDEALQAFTRPGHAGDLIRGT